MKWILIVAILISANTYGQWKKYMIGVKGDTLNRIDNNDKKQGPWVIKVETLRGEPGYEEEGVFKNDRKEGIWRKYTLTGDLFAMENYHWGFKDGVCKYFNMNGEILKEESWRAMNPDKQYDTIEVEDPGNLGSYTKVIIKNEGSSLKNGTWKYYNPETGFITKTEFWLLGKLDQGDGNSTGNKAAADSSATADKPRAKPKEVLDFEKKNAGKKRVKVRDGSSGY